MNKRKYNLNIFLIGAIGYFIGGVIYSFLGGEERLISSLASIITTSILGVAYYLYARKKHSREFEIIDSMENDERGRIIRGKTSSYTLILIMLLSAGIFIFSVLENLRMISILIGVSYIIAIVFNVGVNFYLNNKI